MRAHASRLLKGGPPLSPIHSINIRQPNRCPFPPPNITQHPLSSSFPKKFHAFLHFPLLRFLWVFWIFDTRAPPSLTGYLLRIAFFVAMFNCFAGRRKSYRECPGLAGSFVV
jgi:hypothetical protein